MMKSRFFGFINYTPNLPAGSKNHKLGLGGLLASINAATAIEQFPGQISRQNNSGPREFSERRRIA
jgi:hypothetical protein